MKGVYVREKKHQIPKEELERLYQTKTMDELAEHFGCGQSTIWLRIKEYGIKHEVYGDLGHRHRKRQFSQQHLENMSKAHIGLHLGPKNGNWKGGLTIANLRERGSKQYREWRKAALALRGGKCQECGAVDGHTCECCGTHVKLHVHHLFSFAKHVDKRFDPKNSEVLCPKCHHSRHRRKIG